MLKHRNDGVQEFRIQMLKNLPNPEQVSVFHSNEGYQIDTWQNCKSQGLLTI